MRALADVIATQVQAAVDRRMNQQHNPQWQQAHGAPPQQQPPPGPPAPQYTAPVGPSEGDLREARMAAREYTAGQISFGSVDEQAVAADLAASMLPGLLARGFTPDQAGRDVAGQVAARIKALRSSYEDQAVRTLRSRGLLREEPQAPVGLGTAVGVPVGGTPVNPGPAATAHAKATQMTAWAAEENQQRGWEPATK